MTTQSSALLATLDAYKDDAPITVRGTLVVYKTRRSAERYVTDPKNVAWAEGFTGGGLDFEVQTDGTFRVVMLGVHGASTVRAWVRDGHLDPSDVVLDSSAPVPAGTLVVVSGVRRSPMGDAIPYGGIFRTVGHHAPTGRLDVVETHTTYPSKRTVGIAETVRVHPLQEAVPMPADVDPGDDVPLAYDEACGACNADVGDPCNVGCIGEAAHLDSIALAAADGATADLAPVAERTERERMDAGLSVLRGILTDLRDGHGLERADFDTDDLDDAVLALDVLDNFLSAC